MSRKEGKVGCRGRTDFEEGLVVFRGEGGSKSGGTYDDGVSSSTIIGARTDHTSIFDCIVRRLCGGYYAHTRGYGCLHGQDHSIERYV
jgi:hypothetical protein